MCFKFPFLTHKLPPHGILVRVHSQRCCLSQGSLQAAAWASLGQRGSQPEPAWASLGQLGQPEAWAVCPDDRLCVEGRWGRWHDLGTIHSCSIVLGRVGHVRADAYIVRARLWLLHVLTTLGRPP